MVVGNITEDRLPGGGWAPGGPSLYAARMAAALGAEVTLVTRLPGSYDRSVLEGLTLASLPARVAPRYANTYDEAGGRTQYLLDPGEPLDELPPIAGQIDGLILAPALQELGHGPLAAWTLYPARVRSISLQGLLRASTPEGRVIPAPHPEAIASRTVPAGATAFFSDEDTAEPETFARAIAASGATAILTLGSRGALLFRESERQPLAPVPATPVDPTGAGDCFAAAYTVALAETGDIATACRFALAAGALAVEGSGPLEAPSRALVEERLAKEAA